MKITGRQEKSTGCRTTLSCPVYIHVILNTKIQVKCPSAPGLTGPDACLLGGLAGAGGIPGHPAWGEQDTVRRLHSPKIHCGRGGLKTMSYQLHTKLSQSQASGLLLNKMRIYKYEILQTLAVYRRGCESLMSLVDTGLCKQKGKSWSCVLYDF